MKEKRKSLSGSLVIEETRMCNMNCPHCLRGWAQNINITKKIIDAALDPFENISSLTLTGGEPSLVPELVKYTIDQIIERGISLGSIYVVTNGKKYSRSMLNSIRRAYEYADEKDLCGLCISVDEYHKGSYDIAWDRYESEPFFRTDKVQKDLSKYLINEGNAYYNGIGRRNLHINTSIKKEYVDESDTTITIWDDILYVSAVGDVLLNCDVSYENQPLYAIGNLNHSRMIDIVQAHIL